MTTHTTRAVLVLAIVAVLPAFAPVAPKHQRLREMQAVLKRSADLLPEPIESVETVEPDLFRVRSGRCSVEVRLGDARPAARSVHIPGRRRFRLAAGPVQCR